MKTKRAIAGLAAAAVLLGVSSGVYADGYGRQSGAIYDYAKVLSSQPVIHYVTVRRPVQECWQETQYYTEHRRAPGEGGATLLGAVVGGVIGHQFGGGSGKHAATAVGSIIGATIGNDVAHRRAGPEYGDTQVSRPVRRCATRYRDHREQRIDGYDVIYRYRGQKYSTRMPYAPGRKMKIRVDIRPAR
jgi:uncharacterized protein YcfJ